MSTSAPPGRPVAEGLRLAASTLTIWPVGMPRADRATTSWAMTLAPLVGLGLGIAAAAVMAVAGLVTGGLLAAALGVGLLAVLTRGLHLDGLADLADGLGSGKPAGQALEIMKRSDIGPFGVMALVFTLIAQIAAASEAGAVALAVACVTGRLAVTWACTVGVPAARPEGLGAMVAGTVRRSDAIIITVAALVVALITGLVTGFPVAYAAGVAAGLGAAWALQAHAVRRLGGVTGDVLGALVETATAVALVVCAALI
ncbi:adenosylcobinamide-GDP ribazoletransferase [Sphaerisporangium aureirubrum]|uniref:Adenosylcobinamide-GDP ribazoletransferase n=1 Tax=Sphaerisporangium aureirubrum TaxID=1544736 RepID=A0ABW1NQ17_9ACTN